MHFRFYGASIGRFQKPDSQFGSPLNPQGWNLYSYVSGNPVNFNDPTGHEPKIYSYSVVMDPFAHEAFGSSGEDEGEGGGGSTGDHQTASPPTVKLYVNDTAALLNTADQVKEFEKQIEDIYSAAGINVTFEYRAASADELKEKGAGQINITNTGKLPDQSPGQSTPSNAIGVTPRNEQGVPGKQMYVDVKRLKEFCGPTTTGQGLARGIGRATSHEMVHMLSHRGDNDFQGMANNPNMGGRWKNTILDHNKRPVEYYGSDAKTWQIPSWFDPYLNAAWK